MAYAFLFVCVRVRLGVGQCGFKACVLYMMHNWVIRFVC